MSRSQFRERSGDLDRFSSPAWPSDTEGGGLHVSRYIPAGQIMLELIDRGCSDLTSYIDPSTCRGRPYAGGGYSDIYQGKLRSGKKVAMKSLRIRDEKDSAHDKWTSIKLAAREFYCWYKLRHRNVVPLLGFAYAQGGIAMVSEWMDNGHLLQYLRQNPKADRGKLCVHIAAGLSYIHDNDMIHGDLKALNIMVSQSGRAMITDFGSVKLSSLRLESTKTAQDRGMTLRWLAPELVRENEPEVTRATDVYAYGLTIFETLTEKVPYAEKPERLVLNSLLAFKPPYLPLLTSEVNRELSNIARECWNPVPGRRPLIGSVLQSLRTLVQRASSQDENSSNFGSYAGRSRSLTIESLEAKRNTPRPDKRQASTDSLCSITKNLSGMMLRSPVKREPLVNIKINFTSCGRPSPGHQVVQETACQSINLSRTRALPRCGPIRVQSQDASRQSFVNLNLSVGRLVLEMVFRPKTHPPPKPQLCASTPTASVRTENQEDGNDHSDNEDRATDMKASGRPEPPFSGSIAEPVRGEESEDIEESEGDDGFEDDDESEEDAESEDDEGSEYDGEFESDEESEHDVDYQPESESEESFSGSDEEYQNSPTRKGGDSSSRYLKHNACAYRDEVSPADPGYSSDTSTSDGDWEETSSFDDDDDQTGTLDDEDMDFTSLLRQAALLGRVYRTR